MDDAARVGFSQDFVFISAYCYDHQHHSIIHVLDRETGQPIKLLILPKRPHVGAWYMIQNGNFYG